MSDRPDLDICTCGDFRRDHKHGVGGCLLPFCAQHGMPQCRAFTFANTVTESDRLYQESIEARRPLPVSTLLSARQETIHRDPCAARAARSVKVSDKLPTIDDVRVAAEKAWNWMPALACDGQSHGGTEGCACCEGARRAMDDIAAWVGDASACSRLRQMSNAIHSAEKASTIASYFASEPNPVSEFRDKVRAFGEAGK